MKCVQNMRYQIRGYHEYIDHTGGISTSGDIMIHVGGYHEYIGKCSLHCVNIVSTSEGTMIHVGGH